MDDLEIYIRYKLGQRIFRDNNWSNEAHRRFSYHEEDDYNDETIRLFYDLFPKMERNRQKLISVAWKGNIEIYLVNNYYVRSDKTFRAFARDVESCIYRSDYSGTVNEIKSLIKIMIDMDYERTDKTDSGMDVVPSRSNYLENESVRAFLGMFKKKVT